MNSQFIVLGLGKFGKSIVYTLLEAGMDVLAVDKDPEVVQEVSKIATHTVKADLRDLNAVNALGLNNFDVVIVAISSDTEASLICTMVAKEKGCKYVLAKANTKVQKDILEKVGADRVVFPEKEMGEKIAKSLLNSSIIDFINLSDKFSIAEVAPLKRWIGLTLVESNIRHKFSLNIVAIKRHNKIVVNPRPDEVIVTGDVLVVIGDNSDIRNLSNSKSEE